MKRSFIDTLTKAAQVDENIFLITGDLGFVLFDEFRQRFPKRFINAGVAESNMIGIASGLALSGKNVYCYSIIPFLVMRCFERIRVDLCYHNLNVKLIGAGGGLAYGFEGMTHHAIEDIAIMRSLPNMTVVSPGDKLEVEAAIKESVNFQGPLYVRIGRDDRSLVHETVEDFRIGRAVTLIGRGDVAVIATGTVLNCAKEACKQLSAEGIEARLISMHTLKPIDTEILEKLANECRAIFTVEEHSIIGGLGSTVADFLMEKGYKGLFRKKALPDEYSTFIGTRDHLIEKHGLTPRAITEFILAQLHEAENKTSVPGEEFINY